MAPPFGVAGYAPRSLGDDRGVVIACLGQVVAAMWAGHRAEPGGRPQPGAQRPPLDDVVTQQSDCDFSLVGPRWAYGGTACHSGRLVRSIPVPAEADQSPQTEGFELHRCFCATPVLGYSVTTDQTTSLIRCASPGEMGGSGVPSASRISSGTVGGGRWYRTA